MNSPYQQLDGHSQSTPGAGLLADAVDNTNVNSQQPNGGPNATTPHLPLAPQIPSENNGSHDRTPTLHLISTLSREIPDPPRTSTRNPTRKSARERKPTPRLFDVQTQDKLTALRSNARKSASEPPNGQQEP